VGGGGLLEFLYVGKMKNLYDTGRREDGGLVQGQREAGQNPENTCEKRRKAREFWADDKAQRECRGNSETDKPYARLWFGEKG
jgi:hypothetical protein